MSELQGRIGKVGRNVRLFRITHSGYVTVQTNEMVPVAPAPFRPVTVTVVVPFAVAAPVTRPFWSSVIPAGSPVASNIRPEPSEKSTARPSGLLMPCGLVRETPDDVASWAGTARFPLSGRFREELPIMIWYVPAGVVHADVPVFQYARSRAVTVKLTVCAWPGARVTRWKCLSWRGGSPRPAGAPTYS